MATFGKGVVVHSSDVYTQTATGTIVTVPADYYAIIGVTHLNCASGNASFSVDTVAIHTQTGAGSSTQNNAGGIYCGGGAVIAFTESGDATGIINITVFKSI